MRYSKLQAYEVHLRLYSGSINAAAIQTKPSGFPAREKQSAVCYHDRAIAS